MVKDLVNFAAPDKVKLLKDEIEKATNRSKNIIEKLSNLSLDFSHIYYYELIECQTKIDVYKQLLIEEDSYTELCKNCYSRYGANPSAEQTINHYIGYMVKENLNKIISIGVANGEDTILKYKVCKTIFNTLLDLTGFWNITDLFNTYSNLTVDKIFKEKQ